MTLNLFAPRPGGSTIGADAPPSNGRGTSHRAPLFYQFGFTNGTFVSALASGADADFLFEATGSDAAGCSGRAVTSFRASSLSTPSSPPHGSGPPRERSRAQPGGAAGQEASARY